MRRLCVDYKSIILYSFLINSLKSDVSRRHALLGPQTLLDSICKVGLTCEVGSVCLGKNDILNI